MTSQTRYLEDGLLGLHYCFHHVQLVLEASDHGEPSLTTQVELIVNVRDIDDNPPIFPVS